MKHDINKKNKLSFSSLSAYAIVLLFIFSYTLRMFFHFEIFYTNLLLYLSGFMAMLFCIITDKNSLKIIKWFVIFDFISCIAVVVNGNYEIYVIFPVITYQGLALLLFLKKEVLAIFNLCLYCVIGYFFICIGRGVNPDLLLNRASTNYISIILLTLIIIVYLSCKEQNKNFPSLRLLMCTIITIWSGGRSGIITFSTFMLAVLLFSKNNKVKERYRVIINVLKFWLLSFSFILAINVIWGYFQQRVISSLGSEGRFFIWNLYLKNSILSLKNIIFGTSMSNEAIFVYYGRNLHNSFMLLHARFGIVILIATIIIFIKLVRYNYNKKDILMIMIIISVIIRASTDIVFGGEIMDLVLYYMLFECFYTQTIKI